MTPDLGIEPGPHWWEASALTTAAALYPYTHIKNHSTLCQLLLLLTGTFRFLDEDEYEIFSLYKIEHAQTSFTLAGKT